MIFLRDFSNIIITSACIAPLFLQGCGGADPYALVEVTGVVRLDDQPLENVRVVFSPTKSQKGLTGPSSFGITDSEGKFRLLTPTGKSGAIVGSHSVSIYEELLLPNSGPNGGPPVAPPPPPVPGKEILPKAYLKDGEMTFEVPAGGTSSADFKVKDIKKGKT